MKDVCTEIDGYIFNLRVAAILEHNAMILVNQLQGADFCFLPGGRVAAGETCEEALARELREELLLDFEVGPLDFLCENFFKHDEKSFHEICMFFTVPVKDGFDVRAANQGPDGVLFRWLSRTELEKSNIQPKFLAQVLWDRPFRQKHFVVRNSGDVVLGLD